MISALFLQYKEIFALIPVNNMNADNLYNLTCKALQIVEGFTVVSVISDNNR